MSFPAETPKQTTIYDGSIVGVPPSASPQDPFSTPRLSGGIIVRRYIQSEENFSRHVEKSDKEARVPETPKRGRTPTFQNSESDEAMTEALWRDEEPYMTPTKQGKKQNKGKGVKRPVMPE